MKIGIESQRIFRRNKHGMDVVAIELIRHLRRLDNVNQYLLFARNGPDRNCILPSENFRVQLLKGITYGDWEQVSLPRAVSKMKPDLLHCTANTAPLNCPVPLVLTLHDIIFLQDISFKGTAYQNYGNIYRKYVVPHAVRKAKKIITVSEHEKGVIMKACGVEEERIAVIHNAAAENFRAIDDGQEKALYREKHSLPEKFMLHLGNTAPKKNTDRMIRAYAEYCDNASDPLPIVILDYPVTLAMNVLKEIGREKLRGRFHFPGYVPVGEMPLMYNCCSLFVYPSLQESFGLPVLEAMACGVPVVAASIGALKEVAGDAAVYADPENVSAMAASIGTVLTSTAQKEECVRKGFLRAKLFNWKSSAEKLLKVYGEVTSKS